MGGGNALGRLVQPSVFIHQVSHCELQLEFFLGMAESDRQQTNPQDEPTATLLVYSKLGKFVLNEPWRTPNFLCWEFVKTLEGLYKGGNVYPAKGIYSFVRFHAAQAPLHGAGSPVKLH